MTPENLQTIRELACEMIDTIDSIPQYREKEVVEELKDKLIDIYYTMEDTFTINL